MQLLKDMDAVHKCYFPLLGHPKPFVRDFAAQTLSILLRRIENSKDLQKYLRTYLKALTRGSACDNEILQDGSAKLFFALMRNVNHGFHSRMRDIMLCLIGAFRPRESSTEDAAVQHTVIYDIVHRTIALLTKHTDAEHANEVLDCFTLVVGKLTTKIETGADQLYLSRVLTLVLYFVRFRNGQLMTEASDLKLVHELCRKLLADGSVLKTDSKALNESMIALYESVWRLFPDSEAMVAKQIKLFFAQTKTGEQLQQHFWRTQMLQWIQTTLNHAYVEVDFVKVYVFPNAMELAFETLAKENVPAFAMLVGQLGAYAAANEDVADENEFFVYVKGHRFLSYESKQKPANTDKALLLIASTLGDQCFATDQDEQKQALALAWKFCKALALIRVNDAKLLAFVTPLIARIEKRTTSSSSIDAEFGALRAELWRLMQISRHQQEEKQTKKASKTVVVDALKGKENSFATLSALLEFVQMKTEPEQHALLSKDSFSAVAQMLQINLRSPSHALRLVSLEILARHDRLEFMEVGDAPLVGKCDLLDVCVDLERRCEQLSVDIERDIVRLLGRVKILCRSAQTPTAYKLAAVNHLFGLYHVKFSTIWPHVSDALEAAARAHFADVWAIVSTELSAASFRQDTQSHSQTTSAEDKSDKKDEPVDIIVREFDDVCTLERGQVNAGSTTDVGTHHSLLWSGLDKYVDLAEAKTKFIVPLFLVFLRDQYAIIFTDELSSSFLNEMETALSKVSAATPDSIVWTQKQTFSNVTTKLVRTKFIDQLKVFAKFKNMKGAYANTLLHEFFFDLLMKSDEVVSKLALRCLYCFEKKHLSAYKDQLNRIADSSTFREELTTFDISEEAGLVLREHRPQLLPVLMRILYSKCVSKRGRNSGDTVSARRSAILSYLAGLEAPELASFVQLVVRAFDVKIDTPLEDNSKTSTPSNNVAVITLTNLQPSRILGFLNLLEDLVAQLGVKLTTFVPSIINLLLSILVLEGDDSDAVDVAEDVDLDDDTETQQKPEYSASMKKQIRMLVYRRLAEVIDTFDTLVDLSPWVNAILENSHDAIVRLPSAVIGAGKSSALLEFMVALGRADLARNTLTQEYVDSVILCLSSGLPKPGDTAAARGITPEILDSVLQFMSSLLDGDENMQAAEESFDGKYLLIPRIPFLLEQFVARFRAKAARYAEERYAGSSKKELVFLCRLSQQIDSSSSLSAQSAHDLFQLLLPFLQRNHHPSPADMENILQVLTQLVPLLSEPKKHVLALSKLLAPGPNCIKDRSPREKLIAVFLSLGSHPTLAPLARVAQLLDDMNAFDPKKVDEIDFERRMGAINSLNQDRFSGLLEDAHLLAPVISQCLQSMHDAEFSIRSGTLASLSLFIKLVSEAVELDRSAAEKSPVMNALESLVMPCIRVSVKSTSEDTRRGFVTLLGHIADHAALAPFPFVHGDLALLRNKEDPEADFFYNITHIQAHRKRRALIRLSSLMEEMATKQQAAMEVDETSKANSSEWFSNSTVNNILLPLVLHFIFETQAKSQESIQTEAAVCVGRAAGLLGWSHYLALVRRLLKSIDGHVEIENAIIVTICAVIDNYHFSAPGAVVGWEKASAARKAATHATTDVDNSKVQDSMEKQVLPMLLKYLFKGVTAKGKAKAASTHFDDDVVSSQAVTVRVPLALAIVKVLRRLRAATFYVEYPKLLMSFTKLLKSKDESIRSSARTTLVKITMELGIEYLLPVVEELQHTLRDGYMVPILCNTLHSILEKVTTMIKPTKPASLVNSDSPEPKEEDFASHLDDCIPSMMNILVEELFRGTVENQDGSEQYKSKMKEAKASRSYDSLELLARSITFLPNPSIHTIVSALVNKFQSLQENSKGIVVLQDSLKRIALGLVKNPTVERSYGFLYVFNVMNASLESIRPATELEKAKYKEASNSLVTTWLVNEKSEAATAQLARRVKARVYAKVEMQGRMTGFDRHHIQEKSESITHLQELLNFAVFLMYTFVRAGEISPTLVDPLVPHLMRCASESKNDKAVIHALKCLTVLLNHHELPSMDVALSALVDRLFKIIQKAGAATRNEMVQTCYRALTVILKERPAFRLTEPQLRVLLSFARADLDEKDHQNATYSLLKSIIASRLVISEVYDVMLRVGELLVQSDAQSARANCSSIYITFLLEYPLGSKRIAHHLNFLMNNLSYVYESGRKAVLDTVGAVVKKLPIDILNERAQFFLLPLVLRVANDESEACRNLASDVIKTLLKRIGNHQLNESIVLVGKWWEQSANAVTSDSKLLCTAAQVTEIVLESRGEFMDKSSIAVLGHIKTALVARLEFMRDVEDSSEMDWQAVYHLLMCLLRFSENLPGKFETWLVSETNFLDEVVLALLEYPHAWVRLTALRLLSSYFSRRSAQTLKFTQGIKKLDRSITGDAYLKTPSKLFLIASSVSKLFERSALTPELGDEAVLVLVFLFAALEAFPEIPQQVTTQAKPEELEVVVEEAAEEVAETSAEGDDAAESSEDDEPEGTTTRTEEQEKLDEQTKSKTPVGWLLTRLSYLCRTASGAAQTAMFKLFAALINENDEVFVQRFLTQMINPLYRVSQMTDVSQKTNKREKGPREVVLLAQEVLVLLEAKAGATAFLDAYTFVQRQLAMFRAARKQKRKHELVSNPEFAAKRKIHKNQQKRQSKQLKKRKFTLMKGTASAATRPTKMARPGAE